MSDDIEFKMIRCENCGGLMRIGTEEVFLMDDGNKLNFCGDGCMSAWLVQ